MMAARVTALTATAALMLTWIGAECAHRAGWRVNLTASEPRGLYRVRPIARFPLPRGTLVVLCPPVWVSPVAFPFYMTGDCPGGGRALLKAVVGIPGDRVEASAVGIRINGIPLPGSAAKRWSDRYPEIELPSWRGAIVLGPQQYWVYGRGARPVSAARSFDSRYFGPVLASQLRGLVIEDQLYAASERRRPANRAPLP